jgi:CubicO group peptidase (beta-lactamase class C family)
MDFKAKAKDLVNEYFNENLLVGLAGIVVGLGDQSFSFSFGKRIVEGDTNFSTATPIPIGSTTKVLTATLAMQCLKGGELGFDQAVAEFFPNSGYFSRHFAQTKLIDLLTHTSGLPRDLRGRYFETGIFPKSNELIAEIETQNVRPCPRSLYRYSNLGYALLGTILERAAQQSIDKLFEDRLFDRLDKKGFYSTPPSGYSADTRGYRYNSDLKCHVEQPSYNLEAYFPTGGVYASAEALACFAKAVMSQDNPLGFEDVDLRRMFSIYFLNERWTAGAAIGWRSIKLHGSQIFTQSGSLPGFSSSILICPERQQAIVLVSNSDGFLFPLAEDLWNLVSQTRQMPTAPEHPNLREYEGGFYWLDSSRKMTLKINNDGYLSIPGLSYKPLVDDLVFLPTDSPDLFKIKGGLHDGEVAEFLRNESGALAGLWLGGMHLVKDDSN